MLKYSRRSNIFYRPLSNDLFIGMQSINGVKTFLVQFLLIDILNKRGILIIASKNVCSKCLHIPLAV